MADFVCKCGNYIRAYVPPGAKVACARCGEVLTNARMDDDQPKNSRNSKQQAANSTTQSAVSRNAPRILKWITGTSAAVLCLCLAWLWLQRDVGSENASSSDDTLFGTAEVSSPVANPVSNPEANQAATWSSTLNWNSSFETLPQGSQIQKIANQIADYGTLDYGSGFWDQFNTDSNADAETENNSITDRASLERFLHSIGSESTIDRGSLLGSDMKVLAVQKNENQDIGQIGVLVRYYIASEQSGFDAAGQWIDNCRSLISNNEFAQAVPALVTKAAELPSETTPIQIAANQDAELPALYFTPMFGYLILIFETDSDRLVWSDLIPIPGEVPIRRAVASKAPEFVDMFGEYMTDSGQAISSAVFQVNTQDEPAFAAQLRKRIATLPNNRCRVLMEIAEAASMDPSMLGSRMSRFRKEYPNDMGADALVVSIWCTKHARSKTPWAYDPTGRIFVDAAHRLYLKTSDPLVLEIKAQMYETYRRRQDAIKCIEEAEQLNFQSPYIIGWRIEEAVDTKDKESLLNNLVKLNDYLKNRPQSSFDPQVLQQWYKRLADWRVPK